MEPKVYETKNYYTKKDGTRVEYVCKRKYTPVDKNSKVNVHKVTSLLKDLSQEELKDVYDYIKAKRGDNAQPAA